MKEKVFVVSGANAGIGYETARGIALTGAKVVMLVRNAAKGEQAREVLIRETGNENIELMLADLSDASSIEAFSEQFKQKYERLDVLVNNAGGIFKERTLLPNGMESTFGLNHIGYFLLTHHLMPIIRQTPSARIISVASEAHRIGKMDFDDLHFEKRKYVPMLAYGQSKLANILFTRYLAKQLNGSPIVTNCLHPGTVRTNFGGSIPLFKWAFKWLGFFFKTPEQGARTSLYLATNPDTNKYNGLYFDNSKPKKPSKAARNDADAQKLWECSLEMTGIEVFGK